ncbi:asparagine synthase (glutamine-hydrolyzing) [Sphingomonas sp. UYAg733]
MSICGRATSSSEPPRTIDRTIAASILGSPRSRTECLIEGARLAGCDGATIAQDASHRGAAVDGRIDNIDDLRRSLGIGLTDRFSPARIILAAYRAWGDDLCRHVIGDYSLAVWDGASRRLFLAVDPGGLRPLSYWRRDSDLVFASEQRALLADPDVPRKLDQRHLAHWLAMMPRDHDRSFFEDIFSIAPGHRLTWQNGRAETERWWRPEMLPLLKLPSGRDYEEILRDTLDTAVRCRIDPGEPIGAQLSGGMDSSAVTALAARALGEEQRGLTAFTAAPDAPLPGDAAGRFGDEWPHAAALSARYPNITHVRISNSSSTLFEALKLREAGLDLPPLNASNLIWYNGIDQSAHDRGVRIMLIGSMGNLTISHDGMAAFGQQIRSGRLTTAFGTAMALRRNGGQNWLNVINQVATALLPGQAVKGLRGLAGKQDPRLYDFSIADPKFLADHGVEEEAIRTAGSLYSVARSDTRRLRLLSLARSSHRGQNHWSTRRLFGIDVRDPTGDRRVMDLAFTIPEERWMPDGVPRGLIRRAMAGLVPEVILGERRKGLQAADWQNSFDEALPDLKAELCQLRDSPLASRALDLDRMARLLGEWPGIGSADYDGVGRVYLLAVSRGITAGRFIRRMENI